MFDVPYINGLALSDAYEYTDGHHLRIDSGKAFSLYIAQEIKKHKWIVGFQYLLDELGLKKDNKKVNKFFLLLIKIFINSIYLVI